MPFSTWAWFITSVIGLIAFSVLLPACVLLLLDRVAGTSFFIPAGLVISDRLQPHAGGSPLLWQHLFWFFGHPEVYIAILPGFGIISHILPAVTRKPLAWTARLHRVHDSDRVSELHRVGPSHVHERNESVLGHGVLGSDADHHHSRRDHDVALDRNSLRSEAAIHHGGAVVPRPSFQFSSAAESADSSWRSRRSTATCTALTSWSATSTS